MCLIFIALHHHPGYKLIVAANRDEFYKRKTSSANFWEDHPEILGGRDLEAGGTWLAVNKNGRISMVTNYRDLKNLKQVAPSRGHLVSDYLLGNEQPADYMHNVETKGNEYNGFNLITGTSDELYYYSNYQNKIIKIAPGLHGLSNHLLDTPWPKVREGLAEMKTLMSGETVDPHLLLDAMHHEIIAPDGELPDTGIGLEWERTLSAMFIKSPGYGTRNSTVVMIDRSNNLQFYERVYDTQTFEFKTTQFSFNIQG